MLIFGNYVPEAKIGKLHFTFCKVKDDIRELVIVFLVV